MRKINSLKNMVIAVLMSMTNILIGFIAQKIFIQNLGTVYLGVNGLFSNIISMLSIADLGLGTAIIYNLYKPIVEKDKEKIKALINFYKKSYRIISIIIFVLGLMVIPLLDKIVSPEDITYISFNTNIYVIYILFLIDTVCSYSFTYKRSMLYADQKNYVINLVHIGYIILLNSLQILILLTTKNYYLYLILKIIFRILENLIITFIVNKLYPFLKERIENKIDEFTKKDINMRLKASIFHNIGGFIVLGTDNIIISKFLGVKVVGFYSNYYMIVNAVSILLSQIFSGITASLGNLLVEKNVEKNFQIEKKMMFANFWIYSLATIIIYCVINPFITIWLGKEYLFSNTIVFVIVLNFYFQGMKRTMQVFAEAAGICYENRYVPILEAIVNIASSIILLKLIGLPGVFIGTILSSLILHFYSYPKYIYKPLFKKKYSGYIKEYIKYFICMLCGLILTILLTSIIKIDNNYIQILINIFICIIIPNIIFYIIFKNNKELKYYCNFIKEIIYKIKRSNDKDE